VIKLQAFHQYKDTTEAVAAATNFSPLLRKFAQPVVGANSLPAVSEKLSGLGQVKATAKAAEKEARPSTATKRMLAVLALLSRLRIAGLRTARQARLGRLRSCSGSARPKK
jgi:hypothetical protein